MIEVYDWLEASESPGTVSADSMLYGIGCMNHKLLILIDKMRGLIPELGKIKSDDLPRYLSTFDKNHSVSTSIC